MDEKAVSHILSYLHLRSFGRIYSWQFCEKTWPFWVPVNFRNDPNLLVKCLELMTNPTTKKGMNQVTGTEIVSWCGNDPNQQKTRVRSLNPILSTRVAWLVGLSRLLLRRFFGKVRLGSLDRFGPSWAGSWLGSRIPLCDSQEERFGGWDQGWRGYFPLLNEELKKPQNPAGDVSGQILGDLYRRLVTRNGGLGKESPQNPLNSGLGIILICPDVWQSGCSSMELG